MARSVKKGPFIDKGVREGGRASPRGRTASAGDQDLVATFDDYARHGWTDVRRAQRQTTPSDLRHGEHGRATSSASLRRRARSRATRERRSRRREGREGPAGSDSAPVSSAAMNAESRTDETEVDEQMEARASAKYLRGSAQKARLVVDMIRGKDVNQALAILRYSNKRAAQRHREVRAVGDRERERSG